MSDTRAEWPAPDRAVVRLPDGRRLGYASWGPRDGRPVLLSPGAATSGSLGFALSALERLGLRLIGLDRPGLGASDPAPDRTLLSWADDVRCLTERLGAAECPMVGFSQGGPFALACAARAVAGAVAIVSGTDELASPAVRAELSDEVRALVATVRDAPAEAERFFATMTPARMRGMVLAGSSPEDRSVYEEAGFAAAYGRALEEAFAQGAAGYALDTVLTLSPWPFELGRIRCPVDVWYGAGDTSPVHSPDRGAGLTARIPTAARYLVSGAGGALLWTHGETILETLLERA